MKFRIYTPKPSLSGRALAQALILLGHTQVGGEADVYINWGGQGNIYAPHLKTLNCPIDTNKFRQLMKLGEGGVRVPNVSDNKPSDGASYFPRASSHSEGKDILKLLRGEGEAAYYTEFIPTVHELRFHIFKGKSIRCGIKKAIHPFAAHPNIRSHRNGWDIVYGESQLAEVGERARSAAREAARNALQALSWDFGAVDVGIPKEGAPVVFEVNSAPGIEGNTLLRYARHISDWSRG